VTSAPSVPHSTGTTRVGIPVFTLDEWEFVRVPAGSLIMGGTHDNPLAFDYQWPQLIGDIPKDFWLTRLLVANEQLVAYVVEENRPVSGCETTPIGAYSPKGDSRYGCPDMPGNAWVWTHSKIKRYPYRADNTQEDESGPSG